MRTSAMFEPDVYASSLKTAKTISSKAVGNNMLMKSHVSAANQYTNGVTPDTI